MRLNRVSFCVKNCSIGCPSLTNIKEPGIIIDLKIVGRGVITMLSWKNGLCSALARFVGGKLYFWGTFYKTGVGRGEVFDKIHFFSSQELPPTFFTMGLT